MFIAIVGTPSAGKRTVLEYLVEKHGFVEVGLKSPKDLMEGAKVSSNQLDVPSLDHLSVLSSPSTSSTPPTEPSSTSFSPLFTTPLSMLDHITRNWLKHHVTMDLRTYDDIEPFIKRPFFLLVFVDGPLSVRYQRERERRSLASPNTPPPMAFETFIHQHDLLLHGPPLLPTTPLSTLARHPQSDFRRVQTLAQIHICHDFPSVQALHAYLDQLDLLNEERLRPGWDLYFMTLASLASQRSNCMKRRVGALIVRSKRILSTGYNGTPRGTRNCNQGGCRRCNGPARGGEALDECLCLHAEENALLEAGRERIGDDSVIYCNTMDEASAMVLREGGVVLRQFLMPR